MKFNDIKKFQEKKVSAPPTINYQKYTSNPNFFGSKIFNNYKSNKFKKVDTFNSHYSSSKGMNISDKEIYIKQQFDDVSGNVKIFNQFSNIKHESQSTSLNIEMNIDLLKSKIERLTKLAKGMNKSNNIKLLDQSQEIMRNNYNTNNYQLKYYTNKNIPLQNSKISLIKNSKSPVRKLDVSSEIYKFNFNSKLLKNEQLIKGSNKIKINYSYNKEAKHPRHNNEDFPNTSPSKKNTSPKKEKPHINLIIQQVEEISIRPKKFSLTKLDKSDVISTPFSNILTDEDNLVEDFLKIRSSLKNSFIDNENLIYQEEKIFDKFPSPTNKKIRYNNDNFQFKKINYFTDKDRKTISKIYKNEKIFDPEELFLQYRRSKVSTEKKERSLIKLLREFNKSRRDEEEIDFVISDISYDPSEFCNDKYLNPSTLNNRNLVSSKIESNCKQFKTSPPSKIISSKKYKNESELENAEKNSNPFEINHGVRKNLLFSENIDKVFSENETLLDINSNEKRISCFNNISSIKFLKTNTSIESDFKTSSIKNYLKLEPEKHTSSNTNTSNKNTEFLINQSTNSTSFSNTSLSKKKVTFLDDTTVYNFDRKKVVNSLTYQNLYKSGIKNKKSLNKSTSLYKSRINITEFNSKNACNPKLKSILIKRDSSFTATDIDITSINDKDKSEALEKLNLLIQELELEQGKD